MAKYTEEELLQLKPTYDVAVNFDVDAFKAMIAEVAEHHEIADLFHQKARRRSSHHHGVKPKIKAHKPRITTDDDGWCTSTRKTSVVAVGDDGEPSPAFVAQETLRVKPNNKNIASSRPADTRDIVADKPTMSFNAFAALESDDEDQF
ncbi:AER345Wp [Eremothecium gossypii ATCC 10895]|uniref:Cap-associated protein CAF20 n=1 Tax=Eremothecium gossypii (strain ATCC 10895 / CBS 109.51 / FGSC 9923 / NRRL Y-1056) TaxID=284811 RepID=CAF20_EREGS|nr:AER345Wp [Eremothecium gossypii ATCC 10895]Q756C2.1 RecName: Full=Cap-associated protein CAF20 [Eremothecium gossypii ATCC 10895]AAS53025.1 AER345Wp [Eremothecium gossypii ATCC 10895]AEY97333.1 FAER345Wp [Eremothecium gossypii FDAG1]